MLRSGVTDDINTIHLQISVAADALPPADDGQLHKKVPVVVVEAPDMTLGFDFASGGRASSTRARIVDLTLKKVSKLTVDGQHTC